MQRVQIDRDGNQVEPTTDRQPVSPSGNGSAVCPPLSIAMAGPLSGPDSAIGDNINTGMQLAVDKHNEANPGCQILLKTFDTEGDAAKARSIAPAIVEDAFTVGLVGPAFSDVARTIGEVFDQAGLVAATASAGAASLAQAGWRTFLRGSANDDVQGAAVATYLTKTLGYQRICVIQDGGAGLTQAVLDGLGPLADPACGVSATDGDDGFDEAIARIGAVGPEAVFFSGGHLRTASFVGRLRDAGATAVFVTAGVEPAFVGEAGDAAKDAILSCACSPAPDPFAKEYAERFDGKQPGPFSAEAYDLATILLAGIDSGAITRPELLEFVRDYDGQGIARRYRWTADGELTTPLIWIYTVE